MAIFDNEFTGFAVAPPANIYRFRRPETECTAVIQLSSSSAAFSLDGVHWWSIPPGTSINDRDLIYLDGVGRKENERYIYASQAASVRFLPLGARIEHRPSNQVFVSGQPTVHVASMPTMERALLYEGALVVGSGEGAEAVAVTPVVEVTDWRRALVEITRGTTVGAPRVEVSVGALASAQLEESEPILAVQGWPVDFDQWTGGWLVWATPGASVGPHTVPIGAGVRVYAFEGGDSDGRMTLGVRIWGFR